MNSTFTRATVGFLALVLAVSSMALVALWALERYTDGVWWASLLVVIIALFSVLMIYGSTLHEPIYNWIKEPAEQAKLQEAHRRDLEREAARNTGTFGVKR
jgi:hypothetical protein